MVSISERVPCYRPLNIHVCIHIFSGWQHRWGSVVEDRLDIDVQMFCVPLDSELEAEATPAHNHVNLD